MSSEKLFISAEEGKRLSFPYDWKQSFHHPFDMSRAANEAQTVKEYIADTANRQPGLEILKMLLDFTFATRDQIWSLLAIKGLTDGINLDALLERYLSRHLINKFAISVFEMDTIPDGAFTAYCLDHGARHILCHFYRSDVSTTWKSTNAFQSAELVSKYLVSTEFYLSLLVAKGGDLEYFEPTPNFMIRGRSIRLSARFCVKSGAASIDFVMEVIRKSDVPIYWRKKCIEQVTAFIQDRALWNRYFKLLPTFIFVVEDMDLAQEVAEIFCMAAGSDYTSSFRITTDREIMAGIDKATMYKCEVITDSVGSKPPEYKLFPVVAKIFQTSR